MYSDQVYKKKMSHAGVVRESDNYILYEDVDEIERIRRMQALKTLKAPSPKVQKVQKVENHQMLRAEPRLKPPKELLDNYRYYEDMKLRDLRHKGDVKHRRNSKPHGRETPFNRDSYKKFTNFSPNPRGSHDRKGIYHKKNEEKSVTVLQGETNYVPKKNETLRSKPYQTQTNYSPKKYEKYRSKPYKNESSYYSPRRSSKQSDYYPSCECGGHGYNYRQNDVLERRRPQDTYYAGQGKQGVLRKLHYSPEAKYHETKTTYLRGGRKESYDSYMKPYSNVYEDSDYNYQYKESVNIKRPKRRDSKTYHIRRTERSYSGGRTKFDGVFDSYNDYY